MYSIYVYSVLQLRANYCVISTHEYFSLLYLRPGVTGEIGIFLIWLNFLSQFSHESLQCWTINKSQRFKRSFIQTPAPYLKMYSYIDFTINL